jgi:neuropeptide Y receptor
MLIAMVVIFAICWLPLNIVHMVEEFHRSELSHYKVLFLTTHVIAMSSTIYNPFLYSWLNDNFRKEFQQIVPCLFKVCWCLNRHRTDNSSTQLTNVGDGDLNDRPSTHQMPAESTIATYTHQYSQIKNSTSNGKLNGVPMKKLNNQDISLSTQIDEIIISQQQQEPLLISTNHI